MARTTLSDPPVRTLKRRARDEIRALEVLEEVGVRAAMRIALRAIAAALSAFRARTRDPGEEFHAKFVDAAPVLTQAKIAGHLSGAHEALRAARRAGRAIALADPFDRRNEFLRRSLDANDDVIRELVAVYGAESAVVIDAVGVRVRREIAATMVEIQNQGLHVQRGVKSLQATFDRLGIAPRSGAALETVFRSEMQKSFAAGRWQWNQQPHIQKILWGYRYVTAGDARVRPSHRGLEGTLLPKDHPLWRRIYPPNGFNCRCQAIALFSAPDGGSREPPSEFSTMQDGRPVTVVPDADSGWGVNFGEIFPGRGFGA